MNLLDVEVPTLDLRDYRLGSLAACLGKLAPLTQELLIGHRFRFHNSTICHQPRYCESMKLWPHPLDPESEAPRSTMAAWLVGLLLALMLALSLLSCAAAPASVAERQPLSGCTVSDGDTIRCQDERIRLLGIDAPELAGHCRVGRQCVAGDPLRSKLALEQAVAGKRLTIERVGEDRYGRTLGVIYADGRNTSCVMIAGGYAAYVEKWDNGKRVRSDCPGIMSFPF